MSRDNDPFSTALAGTLPQGNGFLSHQRLILTQHPLFLHSVELGVFMRPNCSQELATTGLVHGQGATKPCAAKRASEAHCYYNASRR